MSQAQRATRINPDQLSDQWSLGLIPHAEAQHDNYVLGAIGAASEPNKRMGPISYGETDTRPEHSESVLANPIPDDLNPMTETLLRLMLVMVDQQDYDSEFIAPEWGVFDGVVKTLNNIGCILGYDSLPLGDAVPDGDGGIRLSWRIGNNHVRFIAPSPTYDQPYVYWQIDGQSGTKNFPNPSDIAVRITWMINGTIPPADM